MGDEKVKDTEHTDGDYLGYGVYAQTLWNRVEAALNKDQGDPDKLGDDPLVMGIFGEWGAGKSFLLKEVLKLAEVKRDHQIGLHQQDDGFSLTVPVFFQPWKYEHEKHLLVPLLLHIEAELSHCLKLAESTSDKAKGTAVAMAEAVKAHLPAVVGGFKTLWGAARTAYQLAEPASAGVLLPLAEWLAGQLAPGVQGQKDGATQPMAKFSWDADRHKSTSEWLRKRLGQRPVDERKSPARWAQQRLWGSRPVSGVNWFEARAYANWLNQQDLFRQRLQVAGLDRASVALPIEAQWERAARASGFDLPPDGREYVWNDDKAAVELRANIDKSGLGRVSPVGLFPPNPMGICDLNGNLWEWQDNLSKSSGSNPQGMRIRPLVSPVGTAEQQSDWLELAEKAEVSAFPALRGGAWHSTADDARASIRNGARPFNLLFNVGFRVVLSLAE